MLNEEVDRERVAVLGRILLVLSAVLGAVSLFLPVFHGAASDFSVMDDAGARALTFPWLALLLVAACGVWVHRWQSAVIGSVVVLAVFLGWSAGESLVRALDGRWTLWGAGTWTLLGCGVLVTAAAVVLVVSDRPTWESGFGGFSVAVVGLALLAVAGRWLSTIPYLTVEQARNTLPFSPGLIGSSVLTMVAAWWVSRLRPARMAGWPVITLGVLLGCSSLAWAAVVTGSITRVDGVLGLPIGPGWQVATKMPAVGSWLQMLAGLAIVGVGLGLLAFTPAAPRNADLSSLDPSQSGH